MEVAFKNVKMKHSLAIHNKEENIKHELVKYIREIPNYQLLQHDPELLLWICNMVENSYTEYVDKVKPDKKELVMTIMTLAFNLRNEDQDALDKSVQFLWNNRKIKRTALVKKVGRCLYGWLERRIL